MKNLIYMKNATILVLALMVSQLSFAQDGEFRFGLKGAANIGWINPISKGLENNGVRLGFSYGIMGDYYFQPNYAVSGELLISQINGSLNLLDPQTFEADTNVSVSDANYKYNMQYLELPVSIKFRTKEIGNLTYWGNFGFAPSFLLNARASIKGTLPQALVDLDPTDYRVNNNEGDDFTSRDFDDRVSIVRFPLIIGGGVEYGMAGNSSLYAGIRFNNSFTEMFIRDKKIDARNNFVSLNVGIFF
jgi:hypothetical protein